MITRLIGKGSFGEIFSGNEIHTNNEVAIKMVRSTNVTPVLVLNFNISTQYRSINIAKLKSLQGKLTF